MRAGGSNGICRIIKAARSPSPDPKRSPKEPILIDIPSAMKTSYIPSRLAILSVVLLSFFGPVLAAGRWHEWDTLRWVVKVPGWLLIFVGCMLSIIYRLGRQLYRWVPWVLLPLAAFLTWMQTCSPKATNEAYLPLYWSAIVGILFIVLRFTDPGFFTATAPDGESRIDKRA
jgi:uncharacterized membrane protein YfcA